MTAQVPKSTAASATDKAAASFGAGKVLAACFASVALLALGGWQASIHLNNNHAVVEVAAPTTEPDMDTATTAPEPDQVAAPTPLPSSATPPDWEALPKPNVAASPTSPANPETVPESLPLEPLITEADVISYLQSIDLNGMGPKGIVINDDQFIAWGKTFGPTDELRVISKDATHIRIQGLGKSYRLKF